MEKVSHIQKLQCGDQWVDWKFQMELALSSAQVIGVVNGTITKTSENASKFNELDNTARAMIGTTIIGPELNHVRDLSTAKKMWDALISVHERTDPVKKARCNVKFWNFRVEEGEKLVDAISRLNAIIAELGRNDEKVTDDSKITRMLYALPSSYEMFNFAWESTPATEKSYEKLCKRLVAEEERREDSKDKEHPPTAGEALIGFRTGCTCKCVCGGCTCKCVCGGRNGGKRKPHQEKKASSNNKRDINLRKCYYCSEVGHMKIDCPKLKKKRSDGHSHGYGSDALLFADEEGMESNWVYDSGASEHICPDRSRFDDYVAFEQQRRVRIGGGSELLAEGVGNIAVMAFDGTEWKRRVLVNVLYVPEMKYKLFSMSQATDKGCVIVAKKTKVEIMRDQEVMALAVRRGKLYYMQFEEVMSTATVAAADLTIQDWHLRLAHQNTGQVKKMLNKCDIPVIDEQYQCQSCIKGKMHREPFPERVTRSSAVGEVVHADVAGPISERSLAGSRYMLILKDEYSHYRHAFFIASKDQVAQLIIEYVKTVERQNGVRVKVLRTDNGSEFVNKTVSQFLKTQGVVHQTTVPYTPQQNGCVEREMRTVMDAVRAMLDSSGLDKSFWAEAANTAVHTLNVTGTSSVADKTPWELWTGESVDMSQFHSFGCTVYAHVPDQLRKKLDQKAVKCLFMGYGVNKKGYRLFDLNKREVITARDCIFIKDSDRECSSAIDSREVVNEIKSSDDTQKVEKVKSDSTGARKKVSANKLCDLSDENVISERMRPRVQSGVVVSKVRSASESSEDFEDAEDPVACVALVEELSYKEAMAGCEASEWKKAMDEEYNSLLQNETWTVIVNDGKQKLIDNRWVYKKKTNAEGQVVRYKARLVARGFGQVHGVDFFETYSPVMKLKSFRLLLALAASRRMKIKYFDVTTAFLNGELEERVVMRQPDGYNDGTNRVYLLRRSLYGLKQASRCWNQRFVAVIAAAGLVQSDREPCVFYKERSSDNEPLLWLGIYVDDGMVIADKDEDIDRLLQVLMAEFQIKTHDGDQFLGMEVQANAEGHIRIGQRAYAERVVERYRMESSFPVSTPVDHNRVPCLSSNSRSASEFPYRSAVGSLNYLSVATRPDISFAVGVAGRYMERPNQTHVRQVKRIISYLKGTAELELVMPGDPLSLAGYCDADYGGCVDTRKSTSGYLFVVAGGTVSWRSHRQHAVALSTAESEYISATEASKEMVWLKGFIEELIWKGCLEQPILKIDNKSAISWAENEDISEYSKHIQIRYHYIRSVVKKGVFKPEHISSKEQLADGFTKALPKRAHMQFRNQMLLN